MSSGLGFLKELSRKERLVPHLNRWFLQYRDQPSPTIHVPVDLYKEKDDAFHPSGDAVGCAQEIYAGIVGDIKPKAFDSGTMKTFANGHLWHGMIYHAVVEGLGFTTWDEVEHQHQVYRHDGSHLVVTGDNMRNQLPDGFDWWARGHIDMSAVRIPGEDEPVLVDVKTMNPRHYRLEWPPEPFKTKYLTQVSLYLDWVGRSDAILLCVEIDSGFRFKEIAINRDDALVHAVYEKWDRVAEALWAGSPPEHTCSDPAHCVGKEIYGASARARPGREEARLGSGRA